MNCVAEDSPPQTTTPEVVQSIFSPEPYYQIQQMILRGSDVTANVATATLASPSNSTDSNSGIILSLISKLEKIQWVIDTGATNHMISNLNILNELQQLSNVGQVHLPNGEKSDITHKGSVHIFPTQQISDVLYIPNFHFNLLSVSKLTMEWNCMVAFYPELCIFQDLCSGKVLGTGTESGGLYLFGDVAKSLHSFPSVCPKAQTVVEDSATLSIWHRRLGHMPFVALQKMDKFYTVV